MRQLCEQIFEKPGLASEDVEKQVAKLRRVAEQEPDIRIE